jgi:hypothetical protein
MWTRILAVALAAVIGTSTRVNATTWFVDNTPGLGDDDENTGQSVLSPFATIQKAANMVSDADTVYVRATSTPYGAFTMYDNKVSYIGFNSSHINNPLDDGSGVPQDYDDIDPSTGYPIGVDESPIISTGDRTLATDADTGVNFNNHNKVTLRNFWITECGRGVLVDSNTCTVENVYVWNTGDRHVFDGRGITVRSSTAATFEDGTIIENCVCYNAGNQAFEILGGSSRVTINNCDCYSDDDLNDPMDPDNNKAETHYYFLIAHSSNNRISNCRAMRFLNPTTGLPTPHGGHGFVVQQQNNLTTDGNQLYECACQNILDVLLLRGEADGNTFTDIDSYIDTFHDTYQDKALGRIVLSGGPLNSTFERVDLLNSDIAVAIFGNNHDQLAYTHQTAALANEFLDCRFDCELAIQLSDYSDEAGANATLDANGNHLSGDPNEEPDLSDGSVQDVIGNYFYECEFVANHTNLDTFLGGKATFFQSAREALWNEIESCIVYDFDKYKIGSTLNPPPLTPIDDTNEKVIGFDFNSCNLYNPNSIPVGQGGFPAHTILGSNNDDTTDPYE